MKNLWLKIGRIFKSKFFIYTVITPAFGFILLYGMLSFIVEDIDYQYPFFLNFEQLWLFIKSVIRLIFVSPLAGIFVLPVSILTYLCSLQLNKLFSSRMIKIVTMMIIGGVILGSYAILLSSKVRHGIIASSEILNNEFTIMFTIIGFLSAGLAEYLSQKIHKTK